MTTTSTYDDKPLGDVWIHNFDLGVVTTLGGVLNTAETCYVIKNIPDVSPPPDADGIPIFFAYPDDTIDNKILPSFVVRRDSMNAAMSRYHQAANAFQYRSPAKNAKAVTLLHPITGETMATGYDNYEVKVQAIPYDLLYTIQIRARYRNSLRVEAQQMLRYAMRIYQPYCIVSVKDSLGETRTYDAFMESPSIADRMTDVADREATFNMTLRVEAELDLNDPVERKAFISAGITQTLKDV